MPPALARGAHQLPANARLWSRLGESRRSARGLNAAERRLLKFLDEPRLKRR